MKVKTSISLSTEIIKALQEVTSEGNRSEFIEKALWRYFETLRRDARDKNDLDLLDREASYFNGEALDALGYQDPL